MPTFPFQYKKIDLGKIINPLILLPIKTPQGWQSLWFLVDSGADTTMMSLDLATQLGLSLNKKKKTKLSGIGANSVPAYAGEIMLKLGEDKITTRTYFINSSRENYD